MENKNTVLFAVLVSLIIGLFVGWFVWGSTSYRSRNAQCPMMSHEMMMAHCGGDMSGMMDGMMGALKGKTGDDFDKTFLTEMIVHHEGAVAMAEAALQNAKNQEIKDMAQAIITTQTTEIGQMKNWLQKWYNQ
jgi:uncharacterized protein (DUF305 family)